MLKRGVAIGALLAAIATGAWLFSTSPRLAEPEAAFAPEALVRSDGGESESENESESESESETETESETVLDRMAAIHQEVHLLEMQRLDARSRGDHEMEARLDREITAARAEDDRLRRSLATPEGI